MVEKVTRIGVSLEPEGHNLNGWRIAHNKDLCRFGFLKAPGWREDEEAGN